MPNRFESNIRKARVHAQRAMVELAKRNRPGRQYDYCTHPNTQDLDILVSMAGQLEATYYRTKRMKNL